MSKKPKAQEIGILLYQKIIEDYCNTVLTPKVERVTSICSFFSCIPAEPPVSFASRNISCTFYPQIAGVCGDIISNRYIFGDSVVLSRSESLIAKYEGFLALTSRECKIFSKEVACRYAFPLCDTSLNKPLAQGVCRKTCEFVTYEKCINELEGNCGTRLWFWRNYVKLHLISRCQWRRGTRMLPTPFITRWLFALFPAAFRSLFFKRDKLKDFFSLFSFLKVTKQKVQVCKSNSFFFFLTRDWRSKCHFLNFFLVSKFLEEISVLNQSFMSHGRSNSNQFQFQISLIKQLIAQCKVIRIPKSGLIFPCRIRNPGNLLS